MLATFYRQVCCKGRSDVALPTLGLPSEGLPISVWEAACRLECTGRTRATILLFVRSLADPTMSEIVRIDDFGPAGFRWLTLKRITVSNWSLATTALY